MGITFFFIMTSVFAEKQPQCTGALSVLLSRTVEFSEPQFKAALKQNKAKRVRTETQIIYENFSRKLSHPARLEADLSKNRIGSLRYMQLNENRVPIFQSTKKLDDSCNLTEITYFTSSRAPANARVPASMGSLQRNRFTRKFCNELPRLLQDKKFNLDHFNHTSQGLFLDLVSNTGSEVSKNFFSDSKLAKRTIETLKRDCE